MVPRILSARVVLISCVVIVSVVSIHFSDLAAATPTGSFGYCASSPDQAAVYFSEIFNSARNLDLSPETMEIENEYNEYLKGRFDFKSNSSDVLLG